MAGSSQNTDDSAEVENGRRWDERKSKNGHKWPTPARIRGGERKNAAKRMQRRT